MMAYAFCAVSRVKGRKERNNNNKKELPANKTMLTSGDIGEDLDHVVLQVPVINHTADPLTQTTEDV